MAIRTVHRKPRRLSLPLLLYMNPNRTALPDAMAEMIPDPSPASSTAGERRVFATLGRLPDDCLIYYEPAGRRRYPDSIAILPEVGVLVIEVKDWRLAELGNSSVNADTVDDHAAWYCHGCPASAQAGARLYAAANG